MIWFHWDKSLNPWWTILVILSDQMNCSVSSRAVWEAQVWAEDRWRCCERSLEWKAASGCGLCHHSYPWGDEKHVPGSWYSNDQQQRRATWDHNRKGQCLMFRSVSNRSSSLRVHHWHVVQKSLQASLNRLQVRHVESVHCYICSDCQTPETSHTNEDRLCK